MPAAPKYCTQFNALIVTDEVVAHRRLLARTRCKQWSCEYCAEINRKQWRMRIVRASEIVGGDWSFHTLTAHSRAKNTQDTWRNLSRGFNRLIKRLRRAHGHFHYVRVYEPHANGRLHIHMLANFKVVDQTWSKARECWYSPSIAKSAKGVGLGYITHSENITGGPRAAAVYVTKYMTKDLGTLPKGIRRIQCSVHFPPLQHETEYTWRLQSAITPTDVLHGTENNYEWYDLQVNHTVTLDDFGHGVWIYPPLE